MATNKFKDLISSIHALNESDVVSVYIPSLKKETPFSPLSVKQQKDILSTGVDASVENLSFMNMMNKIIQDNIKDKKIRILTCDKPLILLQMRRHAVSNTLKISTKHADYEIDLEKHIEECKRQLEKPLKKTFEVTHGTITLTGKVPDLETDTKYNKHFTRSTKKNAGGNKVNITDIIGEIYITELVKYIDTITIGDISVNVAEDVSTKDAIEVFETLPLQVSTKLAATVKELREFESSCLSPADLPSDINITIDAGLFTSAD